MPNAALSIFFKYCYWAGEVRVGVRPYSHLTWLLDCGVPLSDIARELDVAVEAHQCLRYTVTHLSAVEAQS